MPKSEREPVKFTRPPVVEVACGIAFSLPKPIKTGHVGLFWSSVMSEFQQTEDAPTLPLTVENPSSDAQKIEFELVQNAPLRRVWLINTEGTHLLQIQEDRFLYNWKRTDANPEYPSYAKVIAGFNKHWAGFKSFLAEQGLGDPTVRQLELTYFNIIAGEPEFLIDHQRILKDRFLPEPEAVNWRTQYLLPDLMGRLHVASISARKQATGEKVIRLDITARGMPKDASQDALSKWFDLAHVWITQGFADMTSPEAHRSWERTA